MSKIEKIMRSCTECVDGLVKISDNRPLDDVHAILT